MKTDEKLRVLRGELQRQERLEDEAMVILIQEKIEELEQRKVAEIAHNAMREHNAKIEGVK